MQFIIIGKDGGDEQAPARRQASRPAHLDQAEKLKKAGKLLMAAAMLDDAGKMVGSIMTFDFENRQELDNYLESEPYVINKVWQNIQVYPAAVSNLFLPQTLKS